MRWVVLAAVLGCSAEPVEPPSRGGPFAIVSKLAGYERRMMIDPPGFAAFAAGEQPGTFVVTMHTFSATGSMRSFTASTAPGSGTRARRHRA